jgi:hypothetical protein
MEGFKITDREKAADACEPGEAFRVGGEVGIRKKQPMHGTGATRPATGCGISAEAAIENAATPVRSGRSFKVTAFAPATGALASGQTGDIHDIQCCPIRFTAYAPRPARPR